MNEATVKEIRKRKVMYKSISGTYETDKGTVLIERPGKSAQSHSVEYLREQRAFLTFLLADIDKHME